MKVFLGSILLLLSFYSGFGQAEVFTTKLAHIEIKDGRWEARDKKSLKVEHIQMKIIVDEEDILYFGGKDNEIALWDSSFKRLDTSDLYNLTGDERKIRALLKAAGKSFNKVKKIEVVYFEENPCDSCLINSRCKRLSSNHCKKKCNWEAGKKCCKNERGTECDRSPDSNSQP